MITEILLTKLLSGMRKGKRKQSGREAGGGGKLVPSKTAVLIGSMFSPDTSFVGVKFINHRKDR